ncbi:MAG: BamA/TamA family outer membrane protein [Deltaproteobacteria bacterium]|nr:BamA/TamA family outer membrane protein [Deltaproteobacteria bacterium]
MRLSLSLLIVCALAGGGAADPITDSAEVLTPTKFDPFQCRDVLDKKAPEPGERDAFGGNGHGNGGRFATPRPSETWTGFDIAGDLRDPEPTVRALLKPTVDRHSWVTDGAKEDIAKIAATFGYHLVGLGTRSGRAQIHLSPMPMIRRVDVDMAQSLFGSLLEDEVRRRIALRPGGYLPWKPRDRACVLDRERSAVATYLRDEGYYDAEVILDTVDRDDHAVLKVYVNLGAQYAIDIDRVTVRSTTPVRPTLLDEAKALFKHRGSCAIATYLCYRKAHYSKAQVLADVQKVVELFQANQYPGVRVGFVKPKDAPELSVKDPADIPLFWDRPSETVWFAIEIDPRRGLDVEFKGNEGIASTQTLRKKLTFDKAQSADDLEMQVSARAVMTYLQSRGYFDALVLAERCPNAQCRATPGVRNRTPSRDPNPYDHVVFTIEPGRSREVKSVQFWPAKRVLDDEALEEVIATRPARLSSRVLGASTSTTTDQLAADADGIRARYRTIGYRDARVHVTASPDPTTLASAVATVAMILTDRGSGLHVRFSIDEGPLTRISELHVDLSSDRSAEIRTPEDRELCHQVLADLAALYEIRAIAAKPEKRCIVYLADDPSDRATFIDDKLAAFREGVVMGIGDQLRDRLFGHGLPRAEVRYSAESVHGKGHRMAVHYALRNTQKLWLGKVVVRGNFRTREALIRKLLRVNEGDLLRRDLLPDGARRLRATALFNSVNITMPDLEHTSQGRVNALLEVTERFDFFAQLETEMGYSSYNGAFLRFLPSLKNLAGRGISLDLAGTVGFELGRAVVERELTLRQLSGEATLRFPRYLTTWSPLEFQTEVTAFHDRRETPRFGRLISTGATLGLSRTSERPRLGKRPARARTVSLHLDFRSRTRNVDVLRPIGADDDDSQVPITTRTGTVGITGEWEQRVDRGGTLQPLAPEAGYRLEGHVAYATPVFQNTFLKVSAAASRYQPIGTNLVLRTDFRYDHGFPLGNAALLPEVERFFGGGDATVRGYNDDRLATEVVQVGVPPLENVQQIRVLPAGGNIRMLGSIDAQLRLAKVFGVVVAGGAFFDAGIITNQWTTANLDDVRPAVGVALARFLTPFGSLVFERAIPLRPRLGDDPRGRWHINFAARAQF